jgi:hypothetical protein
MTAITLRTRTGEWLVERRPAPRDPLTLVRDRALRDLLDDLDAAVVTLDAQFDRVVAAGLTHEGERIYDALSAAFDYLIELRRTEAR